MCLHGLGQDFKNTLLKQQSHNSYFIYVVEDGLLGKDFVITQKYLYNKFFIELFACLKSVFQENVCPKDRVDRSWLSPSMCMWVLSLHSHGSEVKYL